MRRRQEADTLPSISGLPAGSPLPQPDHAGKPGIVFVGPGSWGDALPLLQLGSALARRGYPVAMLSYASRRALAESHGMAFVEYPESLLHYQGPVPRWIPRAATESRYLQDALWLWRKRRVTERQTLFLAECLERLRQAGWRWFVAPEWCHGVREFAEQNPGSLVHVLLTPASIHSVYAGSGIPDLPVGGWLRRLYRKCYWFCSDMAYLATLGSGENRARRRLGLRARWRLRMGWAERYGETLGLFSNWFAPALPDWPPLCHAGFLLAPGEGHAAPAGDVLRFVGERPTVVFTCGSQCHRAPRFFEVGREVAASGAFRVLLLGGNAGPPCGDSENLRWAPFVALMDVLPRCAAIVHHGGIGTTVQSILSGTPQIIVPVALDQWDQAQRVSQLGAGAALSMDAFRLERTVAILRELISSEECRSRMRELAAEERANGSLDRAIAFLERRFALTSDGDASASAKG